MRRCDLEHTAVGGYYNIAISQIGFPAALTFYFFFLLIFFVFGLCSFYAAPSIHNKCYVSTGVTPKLFAEVHLSNMYALIALVQQVLEYMMCSIENDLDKRGRQKLS